MNSHKHKTYWTLAYWVLLIGWILGAGLNMNRIHGGFLTNYLADVAFPPWFYIHIRGLHTYYGIPPRLIFVGKWFGLTPERAAISILIVGVVSEVKTLYWPNGPITGTFDLMDIVAYAVGLAICYVADRWTSNLEPKNK